MLTGKQFVMGRDTLALEAQQDERKAIMIPKGATVTVLSGPSRKGDTGTVSVQWEGRTVAMFAVDLEARGTEIKDRSAGAA